MDETTLRDDEILGAGRTSEVRGELADADMDDTDTETDTDTDDTDADSDDTDA